MDCCRLEMPDTDKKGYQTIVYQAPKSGSLCLIYAARPGDPAYVSGNMT